MYTGPQLQAPDRSGHCWTSTATARWQRALPDLNYKNQIAVATAGPRPQRPDRSGHCRTSIASARSEWALPDFNSKIAAGNISALYRTVGVRIYVRQCVTIWLCLVTSSSFAFTGRHYVLRDSSEIRCLLGVYCAVTCSSLSPCIY